MIGSFCITHEAEKLVLEMSAKDVWNRLNTFVQGPDEQERTAECRIHGYIEHQLMLGVIVAGMALDP